MNSKKSTKVKMLLLAVISVAAIVSCKKKDNPTSDEIKTNVTDTTKNHTKPPKTYLEIWVIDPTSTSGYTMYDTLKVVTRQEYIANGDSCIMLWGDTAKTAQGHKYIPELLVNLGDATTKVIADGSSYYSVKQLTPSVNVVTYNLTYSGQQDYRTQLSMLIPYNAVYVPNTTLVFNKK